MKPSSKLVFFGTEDFSLPSLKALFEAGYEIAAVVTKPDARRGRSKDLVEPAVKIYAKANNILVLQPNKLQDIENELIELQADVGVLVSYGKILPQRTLDLFNPIGIINIHPSLLPKYRGPAPIEAAIVHGDKMTGISIMQLTLGMDEGPIYDQVTYPLYDNETKPELTKAMAIEGAKLLVNTLPKIVSNKFQPKPQSKIGVSYTTLLSKDLGYLDPITDNAHALERKVRAYLGYPKTRLMVHGNEVIVTAVEVVISLDAYPLVVECKGKTYLALTELIAPSGKLMTGDAYIRGYGS